MNKKDFKQHSSIIFFTPDPLGVDIALSVEGMIVLSIGRTSVEIGRRRK